MKSRIECWVILGLVGVMGFVGCSGKAALEAEREARERAEAEARSCGVVLRKAEVELVRLRAALEEVLTEEAVAVAEVNRIRNLFEAERLGALGFRPIYFDSDRSRFRSEVVEQLAGYALALRQYSQAVVWVEGHCDERGTEAYNLALGDRRALAVRAFFLRAGIEGRRIRTVSYGESRPADLGHREAAWAKNRRAELVSFVTADVFGRWIKP